MWTPETGISGAYSSPWARGSGLEGLETQPMPLRKNRSIGRICCGKLKAGTVGPGARNILVGRGGKLGNDLVSR